MRPGSNNFTEREYSVLLRMLKRTWRPIRFAQFREPGKLCLWRHDVDASMHRALRLAELEAAEGVIATYFVHLHSIFYNALEPGMAVLVRRIAALGHDIGLHFDVRFHRKLSASADLIGPLALEKTVLENVAGMRVDCFSLHNPDEGSLPLDEAAGMINVYAGELRRRYKYVSDSNGYWRFDNLRDVLEHAADDKLHVLTHPEWWTPEPMSPRDRITRCIDGRAAATHAAYDEALAKTGRKNIR